MCVMPPWTEFSADRVMPCFSLLVKCLKNTPAFFAERLNKAMRVGNPQVQGLGGGCLSPLVTGTSLRGGGMRRATLQPRGQRAQGRGGDQGPGKVGKWTVRRPVAHAPGPTLFREQEPRTGP